MCALNWVDSTEVELILAGWAEIENTTCIKLTVRVPQNEDYVFVQKGAENSGCYSSVGRVGKSQVT